MTSEQAKAMDDLKERLQSKERCFWVGGEQPASPDSIFGEALAGIEDLEAELAKFKALAETLAGALEGMHRAVCHETGFAEAVRADSGLAYPWEPLDVAADASLKALRQYKEARDAS